MDPTLQAPVSTGTPYFMGEHALIHFSDGTMGGGPRTFWLVDKDNKTVRPFESETALQKAFGQGYDQAMQHLIVVTPPAVSQDGEISDGVLKGFNILSPDYSIKEDGTAKKLHFSPHQLRSRYGKPIDANSEGLSAEVIDGLMSHLTNNDHLTGVPKSFLNKLKNDQHLMAYYISAMAYGGYHLSDIYADIKYRFDEENKGKKTP